MLDLGDFHPRHKTKVQPIGFAWERLTEHGSLDSGGLNQIPEAVGIQQGFVKLGYPTGWGLVDMEVWPPRLPSIQRHTLLWVAMRVPIGMIEVEPRAHQAGRLLQVEPCYGLEVWNSDGRRHAGRGQDSRPFGKNGHLLTNVDMLEHGIGEKEVYRTGFDTWQRTGMADDIDLGSRADIDVEESRKANVSGANLEVHRLIVGTKLA